MKQNYFYPIFSFLLFVILINSHNSHAQGWAQVGNSILGDQASSQLSRQTAISGDGNIIAIATETYDSTTGSDTGLVRVFEKVNNNWVQIGNDLEGASAGIRFGASVSLSVDGTFLAVGASANAANATGIVEVYERVNNNWNNIKTFTGSQVSSNHFKSIGDAVSLNANGTMLAISSFNQSSGTVRIYEKDNSGNWSQIGNTLLGNNFLEFFGCDLDLSDDGLTLVVGAFRSDVTATDAGAARVYKLDNGTWKKIGNDIEGLGSMNDFFGHSVAISNDGKNVIVGSYAGDSNSLSNNGYAMVFEENEGKWEQVGNTIHGTFNAAELGTSVDINANGSIIAIGAPTNTTSNNGSVEIYEKNGNTWIQKGNTIASTTLDRTGESVSLANDGLTVLVADPLNRTNGNFSGRARIFKFDANLSTKNIENIALNIYPNPTSNFITITKEGVQDFDTILISDINGKEVLNYKFPNNFNTLPKFSIDVSTLTKGAYFLTIEQSNGATHLSKFIRN